MTPDPRLCLALDTAHLADARALVERTRHVFGVYKIGLQLHCAAGRAAIDAVRAAGGQRIFLDLKLHDIPQTVAGAVAALADLGVDLLTVHLAGGRKMLDAARRAAVAGPKLLGVTVLTSLDAAALAQTGIDRPLAEVAAARAALAVDAGLHGLVCSPHEVAALRRRTEGRLQLVTPGIRLAGDGADDQKRIATPGKALADGADLLVIGRAVTAATDVDAALARLRAETAR